jgi:hypothetical protein
MAGLHSSGGRPVTFAQYITQPLLVQVATEYVFDPVLCFLGPGGHDPVHARIGHPYPLGVAAKKRELQLLETAV